MFDLQHQFSPQRCALSILDSDVHVRLSKSGFILTDFHEAQDVDTLEPELWGCSHLTRHRGRPCKSGICFPNVMSENLLLR